MLRVLVGVGCCLLLAWAQARADVLQDRAQLLDGVERIASPGVPATLCLLSPEAFPVVRARVGEVKHAVVAASRFGRGRVVAFGHSSYFGSGPLWSEQTGKLLQNAAVWSGQKSQPRIRCFGARDVAQYFEPLFRNCESVGRSQWHEELGRVDVLILGEALTDSADQKLLTRFVRSGGGVIVTGIGWGWQQLNPEKDVRHDYWVNQVFAPMGLLFPDASIHEIMPAESLSLLENSVDECVGGCG